MKTVSVTEANQAFSRIIREVEETGEAFRICRRGRPIARLVPDSANKMDDPEWRAAYERMMAHLEEGERLGGLEVRREELYDR